MSELRIAGIMRAGAYSPNHIGNDAAIFNGTIEQLRKRGMIVTVYNEEQLAAGQVNEPVIINMCREQRSMEILQAKEDAGCLVINSGYGIQNCMRERMTRILLGNNIPYPDSVIANTNEAVKDALSKAGIERCWIKRGESHSQHKEDVCYVRHAEEAQEVLQEYFLRGIKRAVINRHLEGDLVKFYGVAGTPFFHWFLPYEAEPLNLRDEANRRTDETLRSLCRNAARELNLVVYGGECIQADDGSLSIIDFNDWPSFATCRAEAATNIAKAVMAAAKDRR